MLTVPDENRSRARKKALKLQAATAAMQLFLVRGYDKVTMTEISEASGIARRSLFRYFPTKEDLIVELRDQTDGRFMRERLASAVGAEHPLIRIKSAYIELAERNDLYGQAARVQTKFIFDTPATMRRISEQVSTWEQEFVASLCRQVSLTDEEAFIQMARVSALSAAYIVAVRRWADGHPQTLRSLVETAFDAVGV